MIMYVKSLRQKNNWSQEQLAQLSGLNIRTIQRVEKGESVGVETLKALASVFNVDINELKSKNHNENKPHEIQVELEREKLEEAVKTEVQSKKEFYLLSLFLLGVFVLFFYQIITVEKT